MGLIAKGGVGFKGSVGFNVKTIIDEFIADIELDNTQIGDNASIGQVVGIATVINSTETFNFELNDPTGSFAITTDGNVLVNTILDHALRNSIPVEITAIRFSGSKTSETFTILVFNGNQPPTDINLSNNKIGLSVRGVGQIIGTATAVDSNLPNDIIAWDLTSNPNNYFNINSSTGELSIASYPSAGQYTITIRATDSDGQTYSESFVIELDPVLEIKLTALDGAVGADSDQFGWSVAISSDGNTAIVGANLDNAPSTNSGSAYIFTRSGSTWTQQQKITASDGAVNDQFGASVAISSDGNTAIVGAYLDDAPSSNSGSAYIFTRSGSTWTQQQKLTASDGADSDQFGLSVAISSDGNTAIVGAFRDDAPSSDSGSVYIFTENN